jgi:hypothetical protein
MEDMFGEKIQTMISNVSEDMKDFNEDIKKIDPEFGSSVAPIVAPIVEKKTPLWSRSLARGTNFIPETGLYQLHRREKVISSGDATDTAIYITINNNNSISNDMDAEHVARLMAQTISMRLADQTGKTKYRFR